MNSQQFHSQLLALTQAVEVAIRAEFAKTNLESIDTVESDDELHDRPKILDPWADDYFETDYINKITNVGVLLDNGNVVIWSEFFTLGDLLAVLQWLEYYNRSIDVNNNPDTETPDDEFTYVLFGADAVNIFGDEGIDALLEADENNEVNFELRAFPQNTPVAEILAAADGWNDYAILTKTEYQKIA